MRFEPRTTLWKVEQVAETLKIYLYDDIEPDGYDWWTGQKIESETSANHVRDLIAEAENVSQIEVYINSNGGSVKEGLAIYNQLVRHQAYKTVYIDGYACSIASVIAMAGDKIIMAQNGLMMIHHASACAYGNPEQLRKLADDLEVIDKASCSTYLAKAKDKLDEKTLQEMLDAETWLDAEQCLKYGLCDEIVKAHTDMEAAKKEYQQMKNFDRLQMLFNSTPVPPEKFANQKTNAERLAQLWKNKNEGE